MALAYLEKGIVASNNLSDVSEYVEILDIELITTSMILSKAFEKEIISKDRANSLWFSMRNKGIRLPKDSFLDYYNKLYENDCKKFLKIEKNQ